MPFFISVMEYVKMAIFYDFHAEKEYEVAEKDYQL
jgi:hypothetical protein